MNRVSPQERQILFESIANEIEAVHEMFVVICDFVDDLEDSQVSAASIALFLGDLHKIAHSGKDVT